MLAPPHHSHQLLPHHILPHRHRTTIPTGFDAALLFDHGEEYPIAVADPFSPKEEERLAWYFEQHLRFPFTDQIKAQEAAASIAGYGEQLFAQLFVRLLARLFVHDRAEEPTLNMIGHHAPEPHGQEGRTGPGRVASARPAGS